MKSAVTHKDLSFVLPPAPCWRLRCFSQLGICMTNNTTKKEIQNDTGS